MAKVKAKSGSKKPKKAPAKAAKGKASKGDIRLGPKYEKAVRVPINSTQYAKKESEIAQLELATARLKKKINPELLEIRKNRKMITDLTLDLEENTEERKMFVRNEYHDSRNATRILRVDNGACVEERPMTEAERQVDLEDEHTTIVASDEKPAATPGEAAAAAREEEDEDIN